MKESIKSFRLTHLQNGWRSQFNLIIKSEIAGRDIYEYVSQLSEIRDRYLAIINTLYTESLINFEAFLSLSDLLENDYDKLIDEYL